MPDRITANLPARSLLDTARFYESLGFVAEYAGPEWLTMHRGPLELEFFPHPDIDPTSSWHSTSVWVADLEALHCFWKKAGLPDRGVPRLSEPHASPTRRRMFTLVDLNGSLLRCFGPAR